MLLLGAIAHASPADTLKGRLTKVATPADGIIAATVQLENTGKHGLWVAPAHEWLPECVVRWQVGPQWNKARYRLEIEGGPASLDESVSVLLKPGATLDVPVACEEVPPTAKDVLLQVTLRPVAPFVAKKELEGARFFAGEVATEPAKGK